MPQNHEGHGRLELLCRGAALLHPYTEMAVCVNYIGGAPVVVSVTAAAPLIAVA